MPKVFSRKNGPIPTDAIYVGRPSKWGNPYAVGPHGSREEVIEKFKRYLASNTILTASLHELKGKDLVCWCAPESCHADILLELANNAEQT